MSERIGKEGRRQHIFCVYYHLRIGLISALSIETACCNTSQSTYNHIRSTFQRFYRSSLNYTIIL